MDQISRSLIADLETKYYTMYKRNQNKSKYRQEIVKTYLCTQEKWKNVVRYARRSIRGELLSWSRLKHKAQIRSFSPEVNQALRDVKQTSKDETLKIESRYWEIVQNRERVMKQLNLKQINKSMIQRIFRIGTKIYERRNRRFL